MSKKPLWREAVDAVDREIAPRIENLVQTGEFAGALSLVARVQKGMQREIEMRTRRLLHFVNMPAATDVRLVQKQLTSIELEVRRLTLELDRSKRDTPRARKVDPKSGTDPG